MRSLRLILMLLVAGACGDNSGLPDATLTNVERSGTLYALIGTPVATPSGFALDGGRQVRTDLSDAFDFAYNLDQDGRHLFLPRAALGIDTATAVNPGLLATSLRFDAITVAPSNGYITD